MNQNEADVISENEMPRKDEGEIRKMPDEGWNPRDEMSRRDEMTKWGER